MQKPSMDEQPLLGPVERNEHAAALEEVKRLIRLARPLAEGGILRSALQLVSVMFVGHLGELLLAGASLANLTGLSLLVGMSSSLDTLCGQAVGAGQLDLLGVYVQQSWIVCGAAAVALTPAYAFATPILGSLLRQPAAVAAAAAPTLDTSPTYL